MSKLDFSRPILSEGSKPKGPKNANVQYFSGSEKERIDSLVRETIQNPLDHINNPKKPLKMVFEEKLISVNEIPQIVEIRKTIDALIEELEKLKESKTGQISKFLKFYKDAKNRLTKRSILCLKISDYNTKGLTGKISDQKTVIGRFLGGVGYFDDASSGGGSGGLGKFAPFRFSGINFCFYSSFNVKNEYIYYGWGDNFTHAIDGVKYLGEISVGQGNDVLKLNQPIQGNFLSERTELGTDVFVLGHPTEFNESWIEQITTSVIRNFFAAVIDSKLNVEIINIAGEKRVIDSDTITDHMDLFDVKEKKRSIKSIPADNAILECIDSYIYGQKFNSLNTSVKTPILGECEVSIKQDDDFSKHFVFKRGPKMLIYEKKISSGDLPYSGVFVCNSEQGNEELRNIEDSHHKGWPFEKTGREAKIKKEIDNFLKFCISQVASHESADSFGLSGTSLFSLGSSKKNTSGKVTDETTTQETSVIIPKNEFKDPKTTKTKSGGLFLVDQKGKRRKIEPKKPPYKKRNEKGKESPDTDKKRVFKVSDFKAQIFKNDQSRNEYHLFVYSDKDINIREVRFSIPGASDIYFITDIKNEKGEAVNRKPSSNKSDNLFENIKLNKGLNKFIVNTKFNQKVEILID